MNSTAELKVTRCDSNSFVRVLLTTLRDERTQPAAFRAAIYAISPHLLYAACGDFATTEGEVMTPTGETAIGYMFTDTFYIVPVLRSGLCMAEAAQAALPDAHVYHLGLERAHGTIEAGDIVTRTYYEKPPHPEHVEDTNPLVVIVDPMIATGVSSCDTIKHVKEWGTTRIVLVGLLASPQGILRINTEHPDVEITVGTVDRDLNEHGYILPGLGDAGDRAYNTPAHYRRSERS